MPRPFGSPTGRRSYAAAAALVAVVVVLVYAGYWPKSQSNTVRWAPVKLLRGCQSHPAGCMRHRLDDDDVPSAKDEDWDFNGEPAAPGPTVEARSEEQILDNQESFVLNAMVPGGVGRVPTYASRSSVLAQRSLLKRLFAYDMALPEERLRRAVSYGGSAERIHRVLHKLIRGDAITVAAVGGSVTAGVGAETENLSYRERLFYWIRTTFPNQNHTFHNGALAAAPSSYMSQCIHDYAPPYADLVFVEFTMNDGQKSCEVTTDGRRGFEVLLRKLLNYQNAPAIVVLHWWSPITQDFWISPEDQLDVFTKYYGLPSLSWRDTMHDLIAHNVTGFTIDDLYFDKGHPNGYNGHRYFADMVIGFLRNEAATLLVQGLDVSAEPASPGELARIPEPMFEGNYEGKSTCLRNQNLQDAVVKAEGFKWVNEGKNGRDKWGYVSWNPGDELLVKANTLTYRGNSKVLIGVGILKSYEHMGTAELSCVSGCECEPLAMDGQWDSRTSQSEWQYAAVTQSDECLISVRNTDSTSSGEHKVKVDSFLVTNLHESAVRWFSHIDELKEQRERNIRRKAEQEAKKAAEEFASSGSGGGEDRGQQQQQVGNAASKRQQGQQQQQANGQHSGEAGQQEQPHQPDPNAQETQQSHGNPQEQQQEDQEDG